MGKSDKNKNNTLTAQWVIPTVVLMVFLIVTLIDYNSTMKVTFITCGIYGLYWMYMLNKEINELAGEKEYTDGVLVIVFCIITCGIYGFFWNFKMGEQVDKINGNPDGNYNIIFLILSIFELAIVNHAIMQDTINKAIRHG